MHDCHLINDLILIDKKLGWLDLSVYEILHSQINKKLFLNLTKVIKLSN